MPKNTTGQTMAAINDQETTIPAGSRIKIDDKKDWRDHRCLLHVCECMKVFNAKVHKKEIN